MLCSDKRPIFLAGKKINLRPLAKADIPLLMRWINDQEIRDLIVATFPQTEQQEEQWLDNLGADNQDIVLGIETKEGILIGEMSIQSINWIDRVASTGALIGEKKDRGMGYGTDAKMTLLDYAFNTLNLHKMCSTVIAYNKHSLSYNKKCGYKREGIRKRHIFKRGRYWDLIELGLFKKRWLPRWRIYQETGKLPS